MTSGAQSRWGQNGSPHSHAILTTTDLVLILYMVRDGKLSLVDVAILTEKFSKPDIGYKALAAKLKIPRGTVRYRIHRIRTLFHWKL
jgi:hypothetical protein